MRCEELRERFLEQLQEPSEAMTEHLESCEECGQEWSVYLQLQSLKAPALSAQFDLAVLSKLEARGHFAPPSPTLLERLFAWLAKVIPPAAVVACLLLLLWMGNLASTRPGADVRGLSPENARLWSRRADAVPPPIEAVVAPDRSQIRLGGTDETDS